MTFILDQLQFSVLSPSDQANYVTLESVLDPSIHVSNRFHDSKKAQIGRKTVDD